MTIQHDINAPWTLHFDRDGTEDFGIILDAAGDELIRSRFFWMAEDDDPEIPPTFAALRVMTAAPKLLAALESFLEDNDLADECGEWKWENLEPSFEQARAAIAEARGGRS